MLNEVFTDQLNGKIGINGALAANKVILNGLDGSLHFIDSMFIGWDKAPSTEIIGEELFIQFGSFIIEHFKL